MLLSFGFSRLVSWYAYVFTAAHPGDPINGHISPKKRIHVNEEGFVKYSTRQNPSTRPSRSAKALAERAAAKAKPIAKAKTKSRVTAAPRLDTVEPEPAPAPATSGSWRRGG